MTKYLVTGAAGFLGFALAEKLAETASDEVVAVDNFIRGKRDQAFEALSARPNVRSLDLDLNDLPAVRGLPADIDVVFHLAALNGTQNFYERPFDVVRCCTLPTMNLVEHYGRTKRLGRFVYASSSEAYASTVSKFGWEVPTDETVPLTLDDILNVRRSYGGSKLHGEIAVIAARAQFGLPFTIIRYHNAYGPRMGDKHVIPDFYNRARKGEFALNGFEDTRSFIHVKDAVRATLLLAGAQAAQGEIVNVGGDTEIRMEDLGAMMMEVAGLRGDIELNPSPPGSVPRRAPNLGKLRRLVGYQPEISLRDGLRETARFYLHDAYKGL